MKKTSVILLIFLICQLNINAQKLVDTVRVKGFYIINLLKSEQNPPQIVRKNDTTMVISESVDNHYESSFIPIDSVGKFRALSYWLNHFFDNTDKVFISCDRINISDFLPSEYKGTLNRRGTCSFPHLKSTVLYETTDINSENVFEIYYLDAYWVKISIKRESVEASMIPGKIAQRCINPNVDRFELYYFIKCNSFKIPTLTRDPNIRVWDKQ